MISPVNIFLKDRKEMSLKIKKRSQKAAQGIYRAYTKAAQGFLLSILMLIV